jgi:hypothetical protein
VDALAATAPYFFLSYAHNALSDARDEGESDYWVGELFRDLCRAVEQRAGLSKGAGPGFMDRDRRVGNDWPHGVVQALATCRVFMPLYSDRYFADECCGKEWNFASSSQGSPSRRSPLGRKCLRRCWGLPRKAGARSGAHYHRGATARRAAC